MTNTEKELLENFFDSLDRLFDRESRAIDVYALCFATSIALNGTEYFSILNRTAEDLKQILHSKFNAEDERDEALAATNELRHYLAEIPEI